VRLLLLAGVLCACKATGTFKCMTSDQCRLGDEVGFCEDSGYCTFADTACESHRRYDETAEYPLAGECLSGYVTGHIMERYIVNDDNAEPTVVTQAPTTISVTAVLDDGTTPTVRIEHDANFAFAAPPGAHYTLVMPVLGVFQASVPHIEAVSISGDRPDVLRSSKSTQIKFTYNQTPVGNLWIASTGAYTETLTSGTATNFNFDWFTAMTGSAVKPALLDSTMHNDRLYVNQTANIGGYISIVASATERLTLADGMTANATGTLASAARDQCVQLRSTAVAEQTRLKAAEGGLSTTSSGWRLFAAQARELSESGAFLVANHEDPVATNASLNVTYANPFPGTKMMGLMTVDGSYGLNAAGFDVPAGVWSRVYDTFDAAGASCAATLSLAGTTAIGGALVLSGTAVDTNNKEVVADVTKPVPIAWSQVVSGVSNFWTIVLWEVSDDGAGGLVFETKYVVTTPDTHALLPKMLLQSTHTYVAQIVAVQGRPNAAQGDFVTFTYPSGSTGAWSHSFKIK
jgi:hypothetical protein